MRTVYQNSPMCQQRMEIPPIRKTQYNGINKSLYLSVLEVGKRIAY